MTSDLSALLTGLAEMIDAAGLGVWNPSGVYASTDIGVTIQAVPSSPDHLIALSPYPVRDDPQLNDSIVGVQIRTRGDLNPLTVIDLDHAIFNLLEGLHDATVGGVPVVLMWRQSGIPGPQDTLGRWERSSNYYVQVSLPTTHRDD